jgi:chloride channel 3/4/5
LHVGIISAVIAFLIIRAEMALFDLKEGFCTTSWGTAKRFCCAPHHRRLPDAGDGEEICGDWIEWGDFFQRNEIGGYGSMWGGPEFLSYGLVAVGGSPTFLVDVTELGCRSR